MITNARDMAMEWHDGQLYGEKAYITHIADVEHKVIFLYKDDDDIDLLRFIACLHDLFEDTECTEDEVRARLGRYEALDDLIEALHAITKQKYEKREEYLIRCSANKLALKVKLADTLCNLEHSVRTGEERRILKYTNQINKLIDLQSKL